MAMQLRDLSAMEIDIQMQIMLEYLVASDTDEDNPDGRLVCKFSDEGPADTEAATAGSEDIFAKLDDEAFAKNALRSKKR